MVHRLTVLDTELVVDCDDAALVERFFSIFDSRQTGKSSPSRRVEVRVEAASGRFHSPWGTIDLVEGHYRIAHVYNLLYRTLARSLADAYLLHAAVVGHADRAWIVAGPAGAGKSSLARALIDRGFALLSDDIAPLATADGRIYPYPRRVGIVRDPLQTADSESPGGVVVGNKTFVLPEKVGARVASRPLAPGAVFLMNPYLEDRPGAVPMRLGIVGDGGPLLPRLRGIDGVVLRIGPERDRTTIVELTVRGAGAFVAVDRAIEESNDRVLFHERGYGERKQYADSPELQPISVREAAVELLRETLNREAGSALMTRHRGSAPAALFELGGLLSGVPCHRLLPGKIEATADLLAEWIRQARPGDSGIKRG